MRRFECRCGRPVYFDNHRCMHCGRTLAFDPEQLDVVAFDADASPKSLCSNRSAVIRCNWTVKRPGRCRSCRMSKLIPALSKPENREWWRLLEAAKRRLLYDLMRIGLPVDEDSLTFRFKEDRRTNPNVIDEHVGTGHAAGVITINAAEADDVFREQMRVAMNEPFRTLLGHFRHESGHYYRSIVVGEHNQAEAMDLFGDESRDYERALATYYENGPPSDWPAQYISAYAAAHPSEDWAESWAHYLHLRAMLEAAASTGLVESVDPDRWREEFIDLVIRINEVMRALGQADAYPFVITDPIADKIDFVHRAVSAAAS